MCLTGGPSGKKRTEEWKENAQRYWLENFSGLMEGINLQVQETKYILIKRDQIHTLDTLQ